MLLALHKKKNYKKFRNANYWFLYVEESCNLTTFGIVLNVMFVFIEKRSHTNRDILFWKNVYENAS